MSSTMARSLITVHEVAASLHLSVREVIRMAEDGILPAVKVKSAWQFRAGEVWNWVEANLHLLPSKRAKDKHPTLVGDLLLDSVVKPVAIAVNIAAKTKPSLLRELVRLAERADPTLDAAALLDAVLERESKGSTALQDGVAVPHPARPVYSEGPVIAAARTAQGIGFGERGGGTTDLFFLICCPQQIDHLLYLGRLCRLLIDKALQQRLREAADADQFADALLKAEAKLCQAQ
jgi:nitrogen PTS system EIIA component